MSYEQANAFDHAARCRRILFRSWHRGTREMDLILGRFANAEIKNLSKGDLCDFERLLEAADPDLFGWITGEAVPPAMHHTPLFRKILAFHGLAAPFDT
ncbi:MAG: succinate dehydrogenase assembly factor 2 [Methylocapsa sp.]|nr:succinate dehydrogenase assembly factor 2 [Methylocapsa sp.]